MEQLISWLLSEHHVVNFFHLARTLVSAKQRIRVIWLSELYPVLQIVLEEELKLLDSAWWLNYYYFVLFECVCVCVCVLAAQSCPTLCCPMDWSPPGSFVRGILQARLLEWVAISFSYLNISLYFWIFFFIFLIKLLYLFFLILELGGGLGSLSYYTNKSQVENMRRWGAIPGRPHRVLLSFSTSFINWVFRH